MHVSRPRHNIHVKKCLSLFLQCGVVNCVHLLSIFSFRSFFLWSCDVVRMAASFHKSCCLFHLCFPFGGTVQVTLSFVSNHAYCMTLPLLERKRMVRGREKRKNWRWCWSVGSFSKMNFIVGKKREQIKMWIGVLISKSNPRRRSFSRRVQSWESIVKIVVTSIATSSIRAL